MSLIRPEMVAPTPAHRRGIRLEYRARRDLQAQGWVVIRSWMSRSAIDLAAIRDGYRPLLVQCRTPGYLIPAERVALLDAARRAGADALVVGTGADGELAWYRLTGPEARDREPWDPGSRGPPMR